MTRLAPPPTTYFVRDAEAGDLASIFRLYKSVESEDPIVEEAFSVWWRWLFIENPADVRLTLGGFDSNGSAVGHLALLPFEFVIDGQVMVGGFPCQLMVDQALRQTLLYPTLVKRLFGEYQSRGFDFCYAVVTRARVLRANVALGFKPSGSFPVYGRPYRIEKLISKRFGRAAGRLVFVLRPFEFLLGLPLPFAKRRGISVTEVESFPPEANALLGDVSRWFRFTAHRTSAIANWRFTRNCNRPYRILLAQQGGRLVGYAVVRRMPMKDLDALAIVDFGYEPSHKAVGHALMREVHRIANEEGVDLAATLLNPASPFLNVLRMWGFIRTPESFTLITHEPRRSQSNLHERRFEDWHITWFDHDFV